MGEVHGPRLPQPAELHPRHLLPLRRAGPGSSYPLECRKSGRRKSSADAPWRRLFLTAQLSYGSCKMNGLEPVDRPAGYPSDAPCRLAHSAGFGLRLDSDGDFGIETGAIRAQSSAVLPCYHTDHGARSVPLDAVLQRARRACGCGPLPPTVGRTGGLAGPGKGLESSSA